MYYIYINFEYPYYHCGVCFDSTLETRILFYIEFIEYYVMKTVHFQ